MAAEQFFGSLIGGFLGVFLIFALLIGVALYVYTSLAIMAIAKKNRVGPLWLAWIPVVNGVLLLKIAKLRWQWIFALFVGIIPVIGGALIMAGLIYVWWQVCKHMHKPEWYAILMIVPVVNLIVMGYLAWGR